jgi:glycosyltransferase involved in cell wall biosynthesis
MNTIASESITNKQKIVLLEYCDYIDFPTGGQLTFAKQMLSAFSSDIALVGLAPNDSMIIGSWIKRIIDNKEYDYFAIARKPKKDNLLIPMRLLSFFAFLKYRKAILRYPSNNYFIQSPEVYFTLFRKLHLNICLRLPGLNNPLRYSRFWYGKYFAYIYEILFFRSLQNAKVLLASADSNSLIEFVIKGCKYFESDRIKHFPTRYDSTIFYFRDKVLTRNKLELEINQTLVVTVGRLNEKKGWRFLIDSFVEYVAIDNNSIFVIFGDGEDYKIMMDYILQLGMADQIFLKGRSSSIVIAEYLSAADIFVMGSYAEGWSNALQEAVVSGAPICTTDFSSASDLVENGINGFIVRERDTTIFSKNMLKCKEIPMETLLNKSNSLSHLATVKLKDDILSKWMLS